MRIKALISYDGSEFYGFQSQKSTDRTVVGAISKALRHLGITSQVVGSGRTDRGVHATAQVIHFDLPDYWSDLQKLQATLNHHLHPAIHIRTLTPTDRSFHARYSARRRAYRYLLSQSSFSPFRARYLLFDSFDDVRIAQAVSLFEGTHDFAYFHKTGSNPGSTIRTIYKATSYRHEDLVVLYFEADGFLRAQVRMMVDFLLAIAKGEATKEQLKEQLTRKKRHRTTLAPPQGLYLCRVIY